MHHVGDLFVRKISFLSLDKALLMLQCGFLLDAFTADDKMNTSPFGKKALIFKLRQNYRLTELQAPVRNWKVQNT